MKLKQMFIVCAILAHFGVDCSDESIVSLSNSSKVNNFYNAFYDFKNYLSSLVLDKTEKDEKRIQQLQSELDREKAKVEKLTAESKKLEGIKKYYEEEKVKAEMNRKVEMNKFREKEKALEEKIKAFAEEKAKVEECKKRIKAIEGRFDKELDDLYNTIQMLREQRSQAWAKCF